MYRLEEFYNSFSKAILKRKKIFAQNVVMNFKKNNLYIDTCSYKAAKFACKNWHYSKSSALPATGRCPGNHG